MNIKTTAKLSGALLASLLAVGVAQAAELKLKPAQAKIIDLAEKPGTIIVSHPEFVSVQMVGPSKMLVQGLTTGYTNLLVLNKKGEKVANLDITISKRGDKRFVHVYQAGELATMVCNPECAPAPTINDSFRSVIERTISARANKSYADTASENMKGLTGEKNGGRRNRPR